MIAFMCLLLVRIIGFKLTVNTLVSLLIHIIVVPLIIHARRSFSGLDGMDLTVDPSSPSLLTITTLSYLIRPSTLPFRVPPDV